MKHVFTFLSWMALLGGLITSAQAQTKPFRLLPTLLRQPAVTQQTPAQSARQMAPMAATTRYVKAGANGNGTSWSNASGDLQAMINASASGDQVWIAGGIYKPNTAGLSNARTAAFSLKNGVSVLGGFTGAAGTEGNISTRTAMPSSTTLSGDLGQVGNISDNCYHVVNNDLNGLNNSAILDGVTITAGNANGIATDNTDAGGGMINNVSTPTINSCLFIQNYATIGAALLNANSSGTKTMNCSFINNASAFIGGLHENTVTNALVINCYFEQNQTESTGAAYTASNSTSSLLVNCTFRDNQGATYNQTSTINMVNSLLWNNGNSTAIRGGNTAISFSLLEPGVTNYTDGGNNRTATFSPFENATGPTLKSCAPAIDAGNNAANTTTTDVLGNARKVRTIDMGAAEFGGTTTQPALLSNLSQSATVVCAGQNVTLAADLSGTGPFTVELFRDNTSIDGQTTFATATRITLNPSIGQSGSYQFVATSACNSVTTTFASITANPLPTQYAVTGNSSICEGSTGTPIGLAGSQTGVNYQLLRGTTPVGSPVAGTGSAISFGNQTLAGTYTVQATNTTTACQQTMSGLMNLTVNPLPTQYSVTGGGAYCAGSSGVAVGLSGSQTGVSYQLRRDGTAVGNAVGGTGNPISFGDQTAQGTYTVLATNSSTSCQRAMSGSQTVTINPLPNVSITGLAATYCQGAPAVTLAPLGNPPGGSFAIDGTTATVLSPAALSVGDHQVTYSYTDVNGCTNAAAKTVTVKQTTTAPTLVTQAGGPYPAGVSSLTISQNTGNVMLTVSGCQGGTINWNGGNANTLTVSTANLGTQSFTATCTSNGCTSPTATATVTVVAPTLKVLSRDPDNGQLDNNTIKPYLLLQNAGTTPIPYSSITLRYWLTTEDNVGLIFQKNYVAIGQGNLNLQYVPISPARQGATGYIEYSFSPGAGNLAPNGDSGPLEVQANKQDYSRFFQGDDYSYINNNSFTLNPRITAYQNGVIFYGQEPTGTGSTRVAAEETGSLLQVKVLGNPVVGQSAEVEISGVSGQTVQLKLVDLQGKLLYGQSIKEAGSVERVTLPLGNAQGILLLNISTVNQHQMIKLIKQ